MANGWIRKPNDLGIFDRHVYDQMVKWCPGKEFGFYIIEIIALYDILYI